MVRQTHTEICLFLPKEISALRIRTILKMLIMLLNKAGEMGMEVFLFPAYLGYDDGGSHEEGWYAEVNANGPTKMYQYGKYLGQRYKDYKNIIWVMGGDCAPGNAIDEIREMVRGIEENAGPQIFTVHNGRFQSGLEAYTGEKWVDLNTTYASESTTAFYLKTDFQRSYPFYYFEGTYENLGAYLTPIARPDVFTSTYGCNRLFLWKLSSF